MDVIFHQRQKGNNNIDLSIWQLFKSISDRYKLLEKQYRSVFLFVIGVLFNFYASILSLNI